MYTHYTTCTVQGKTSETSIKTLYKDIAVAVPKTLQVGMAYAGKAGMMACNKTLNILNPIPRFFLKCSAKYLYSNEFSGCEGIYAAVRQKKDVGIGLHMFNI